MNGHWHDLSKDFSEVLKMLAKKTMFLTDLTSRQVHSGSISNCLLSTTTSSPSTKMCLTHLIVGDIQCTKLILYSCIFVKKNVPSKPYFPMYQHLLSCGRAYVLRVLDWFWTVKAFKKCKRQPVLAMEICWTWYHMANGKDTAVLQVILVEVCNIRLRNCEIKWKCPSLVLAVLCLFDPDELKSTRLPY